MGFSNKIAGISFFVLLTIVAGCKKKNTVGYKYNNPYDLPCIKAANAVNNDDAAVLNRQLQKGVNPNLRFSDNSTLLHSAANLGSLRCIDTLIDNGANVNAQGQYGTPLHSITSFAVPPYNNNVSIKLLNAGIDVTLKNPNGFTALDNARANNLKEIEQLLEARMKELGVEIEDSFIEISAVPEVSIKKVKGYAAISGSAVTADGRVFGQNVTILDVIKYAPTPSGLIFGAENLPDDIFWIEIENESLYTEQGWRILKDAFEKTFNFRFILEKRLVDMYALRENPSLPLNVQPQSNSSQSEFDWDYTANGYHLKNCQMDNLCAFLGEEFEIEVINETNSNASFNFYIDYENSALEKSLQGLRLSLHEIQKEREVLTIRKYEAD